MSDLDELRDNVRSYKSILNTNMNANLFSISSVIPNSAVRIDTTNSNYAVVNNWYSSNPTKLVKYSLFISAYINSRLKLVISEYMNRNHDMEIVYER